MELGLGHIIPYHKTTSKASHITRIGDERMKKTSSIYCLGLAGLSASAPLTTTDITTRATGEGGRGYAINATFTSKNFFDEFSFFNAPDPTNGHVTYQSRPAASEQALAGMLPSLPHEPIYLGVEHKAVAPNGRASVRVQSKQTWKKGLFILDIVHMPTGCGTWPAAWLVADGPQWPVGGEIDVLEGVNDQSGNKMTLHTTSGCSVSNSSSASGREGGKKLFSGDLETADCDVNASGQSKNAGCQISNSDPASFGTAFNKAGGGVYAVEWSNAGISIWFFGRGNTQIPTDLATALSSSPSTTTTPNTNTLKPESWPTPQAHFSSSSCDIEEHFAAQTIVINTSLCGDWAGKAWDQSPVCKAKAQTCEEFVAKNPAAFEDAWWGINKVMVWQK